MTKRADRCVFALNSLLKKELSAIESYEDALSRFAGETLVDDLVLIRNEHFSAVETLREHVINLGGDPCMRSSPWGSFALEISSTSSLLQPEATLAALRRGEENGLTNSEEVAAHDELPEEDRKLISSQLLPQLRMHMQTLDRLISETC